MDKYDEFVSLMDLRKLLNYIINKYIFLLYKKNNLSVINKGRFILINKREI